MKETFYFTHDYNARADRKLVNVTMKHGMAGYGIYWCIIEMLYEEGGYLPFEYDSIAFQLRSDSTIIKSIISDFELFENDKEKFWSNTVIERLNIRAEKSEKARESINKRWKKYGCNTNELQTNTKRNTIKESKEKESIVKDIKGEDIKGYKNKNSRKSGKEFFSDPDKEPEERKEEESNRARAHARETGIESDDNNCSDLIGDPLVPDRNAPVRPTDPKDSTVTEEPEPKKSAEPKTKSVESETKGAEPKVNKVRVPDWDDF